MHLTDPKKITLAKWFICAAFFAMMILSFQLWLTDRNYPLAPIFDFLPQIPPAFELLPFAILTLLLMAIVLMPNPSVPIWIFAVVYFVLVALDENRLQPFFYMLLFMLISISHDYQNNSKNQKLIMNCLRIILVGVYFWSGIHKINIFFVDRLYYYILTKVYVAPEYRLLLKYSILIIPLIEVVLPLTLLVKSLRKAAVILIMMMHLGIIIILNPLVSGINNLVILPWNFVLILLVPLLFWKMESTSLKEWWNPQRSVTKWTVIILCGLMPAFNFINLWDYYLSFNLYSCKVPYGAIYITPEIKKNLPEFINPYILKNEAGEYIECTLWILGELNVNPYPQERTYKKTVEYICSFSNEGPCPARLVFYRRYEDLLK